MEDRRSSPQYSTGATDTNHLLYGIGAATASDEAVSQEQWLKASIGTRKTETSKRRHLPLDRYAHGSQNLLHRGASSSPQDSTNSQTSGHLGRRPGRTVEYRQETVVKILDTGRDRGPLSPAWAEDRFVMEQMPRTNSPASIALEPGTFQLDLDAQPAYGNYLSNNDSGLGSFGIAGAMPSHLLIGPRNLPTPPASDSQSQEFEYHPIAPLDPNLSPPLPSWSPAMHNIMASKRLRKVSPQTSGHAGCGPICTVPYNDSTGSLHDMDADSQTSLEFRKESIRAIPCNGSAKFLPEKENPTWTRTLSNHSNDSAYESASSAAHFEQFTHSHISRVPSPLRNKLMGSFESEAQSSTLPATSGPIDAYFGPSIMPHQNQLSRNSHIFGCRFHSCFEYNRMVFLDEDHRHEHERTIHGIDYTQQASTCTCRDTVGEIAPLQYSTETRKTICTRHPRTDSRATGESVTKRPSLGGCVAGSQVPAARRSPEIASRQVLLVQPCPQDPVAMVPESGLLDKSTPSPNPSAPRDSDTRAPTNTSNVARTPEADSSRSGQGSQSTSSEPSPVSSDGELVKPMPKAEMDDMLDRIMEDFEGMFHYFLGLGMKDGPDASNGPDSDDEDEDSDLEDNDSPTHSILSPMSHHTGASHSSGSSILDSKVKQHPASGQPGRTSETPKSTTSGNNSSRSAKTRNKRKADASSFDDGNGEGNSRKKRQKSREPEDTYQSRKLACPFFQRDPSQTPKASSCVYPGFPSIARLKEHLYRNHLQPPHCVRCYKIFEDQVGLNEHHLAEVRCSQLHEKIEIEGITPNQEKQLRNRQRREGVNTEEDKWIYVFHVLFPDVETVPSAYCDHNLYTQLSPDSISLREFEMYSNRELPRLVRQQLEHFAQSERALMEERLRSRMVEVTRLAAEQLFLSWRSSNSGIGGATPSNELRAPPTPAVPLREIGSNRTLQTVQSSLQTRGAIDNFMAPPPSPASGTVDARTAMAEAQSQVFIHQEDATATNNSQSDSTYGTLPQGSSYEYHAPQPPSEGSTQQRGNFGNRDTSSFPQVQVTAGPSLPPGTNAFDPNLMHATYASAPQSHHLSDNGWSMWIGSPNEYLIDDGYDLFNGQTIPTEEYPNNPVLLPPYPGPRMDGDAMERQS